MTEAEYKALQEKVDKNKGAMSQEEVTRRFKAGIPIPIHRLVNEESVIRAKGKIEKPLNERLNKTEARYAKHLEQVNRQTRKKRRIAAVVLSLHQHAQNP